MMSARSATTASTGSPERSDPRSAGLELGAVKIASAPADAKGPLWSRGFHEHAWAMWGVYLLLPLVLGLLYTPADQLHDLERVRFNVVCNAIGTLCIAGCAHLLYGLVAPRALPGQYRKRARLLIHAGVITLAVLVGAELSLLLELPRHPQVDAMTLRLAAYRNGLPLALLIVGGLQLLDQLSARAHDAQRRELAAARASLRARSQALQARTHPHFFFNSLNALSELVHRSPAQAEEAILQLAALYRYTLEASRAPEVALRRELAALADYIALERIRFGARLDVELEVDPAALDIAIPPLSLQPIVENAIRHGLARAGGGHVRARAHAKGEQLVIVVTDDGAGASAPASRGSKTSLEELAARLELLYGDRAALRHGPRPRSGGYEVELRVPLRAATSSAAAAEERGA